MSPLRISTPMLLATVCAGLLFGQVARAELNINGFADVVGSKSSSDYPLNQIGNAGRALTFDGESRLGLNLSSPLSDSVDFAGQLVARGSDGGAYSLKADWVFLTYRPSDEIKFRIGRQISPLFLYSEQYDVGYTYLWTRLPSEVYGTLPLKEFTGGAIIASRSFGPIKATAELYGGGADFPINSKSNSTTATTQYSIQGNNLKGISLDLRSEEFRVHLAYLGSTHSKLFVPSVAAAYDLGTNDNGTIGASYDSKKLLLLVEALRVSSQHSLGGSATALYSTLGYHVLSTLTPYISYSWLGNDSAGLTFYPGSTFPSASSMIQGQSAWTAGLNFHAGLAAAIKLELMRTALRYASSSLNFQVNTVTATTDFVF